MARGEVNLGTAQWRIPAGRAKNGREHIVPLTAAALEIVRAAIRASADFEHLFPAPGSRRGLHVHRHSVEQRLGNLAQPAGTMAHIGCIVTMWAEIESRLGDMFADFLGADVRYGVAVFLALRAEAAQRQVLLTSAELKLAPEKAAKLAKFMKDLKDGAEARNRVATAYGASATNTQMA